MPTDMFMISWDGAYSKEVLGCVPTVYGLFIVPSAVRSEIS